MRYVQGLVLAVCGMAAGALVCMAPAHGQECPGNPNALGTSRVLQVEAGDYGGYGVMQYPESLPLRDKEVVLSFDDGPLPPYSEQVLDLLAAQCVKATYFLVGSMARAYPATVRRMHAEGHTIGTHSQDHPSRFQSLSGEKLQHEIDQGIAAVGAALGDPKGVAPFFRVPGLAQSSAIEKELAARSLIVFSSDTVADDWFHRIKSSEIVRRAMRRLEARGKGILLLHDIHGSTVAALPELLKQLKEQGFHVVHAVPAPPPAPVEMAGAPLTLTAEWVERRDNPVWPEVVATDAPAELAVLPAPDTSSFDVGFKPAPRARIMLADGAAGAAIPGAAGTQWPDGTALALPSLEVKLPALRKRDLAASREEKQTEGAPERSRHGRAAMHEHERARAVGRSNRYAHRPALGAAQHMRGQLQKPVTPSRKAQTHVDHADRVERSRQQISCCS
jgi:peptidoglycan/xylan/chitin deacetylase (PgdA/CDA1 family)